MTLWRENFAILTVTFGENKWHFSFNIHRNAFPADWGKMKRKFIFVKLKRPPPFQTRVSWRSWYFGNKRLYEWWAKMSQCPYSSAWISYQLPSVRIVLWLILYSSVYSKYSSLYSMCCMHYFWSVYPSTWPLFCAQSVILKSVTAMDDFRKEDSIFIMKMWKIASCGNF